MRLSWLALSRLTALECRRNRTVHAAVVIYILLLTISILLASVTMGTPIDIISDFGFATMSILGSMIGLILAVQLTRQDTEQRIVYLLVPRLSTRLEYPVAKFLGIAATMNIMMLILSLILALVMMLFGWEKWGLFLQTTLMILFECWLSIAIGLLFAYASSLFLALFLATAVLIAGHFSYEIKAFGEAIGNPLEVITDIIYYILPNLENLNLRNNLQDSSPLGWEEMALGSLYAGTELALILCIASLIFASKDLHNK